MNTWQKGAFYGLIFIVALSIIFTVVLIIIDIILRNEGLPHMCFVLGEPQECSFSEALQSRFKFMLAMISIFGPAVALIGGIIGYLINQIKIEA